MTFAITGIPIKVPHLKILHYSNLMLTRDIQKGNQLLIECSKGLVGKVKLPADYVIMGDMIKCKRPETNEKLKKVLGYNAKNGSLQML